MRWIFNLQCFRENRKLAPGGETGPLNDTFRHTTERIGANIMGKRMFDQGECAWQFRIDKILDSPTATHLRYVRD